MEALRVGVCEDRPEDLRALLRLLAGSPLPCETETFTCGEAFLRRFYPGRYDLVLVDPRMGGAEGLETVSRLRERDGGVPVAFYSSGLEHAAEGYRLRVDRYLTRPCAPEDLGELLALARDRLPARSSLIVPVRGRPVALRPGSIRYAEQDRHSCHIHLRSGEVLRTGMKLGELAGRLPDPPFFQCHKSYLVNLSQVRRLNRELAVFEMRGGGNAYIRRGSLRSAEVAFLQYGFQVSLL
ncbi:MAG: response regulator transcription factor [Oscillospiraceae bacterium]|nr:response regulator transcription factor [Oscillospiraceae bacterium]